MVTEWSGLAGRCADAWLNRDTVGIPTAASAGTDPPGTVNRSKGQGGLGPATARWDTRRPWVVARTLGPDGR